MFCFFTELNRKRPPLDEIDLMGFTTAAIVHAGDDRTMMENLEALPFMRSEREGDRWRDALRRSVPAGSECGSTPTGMRR